MIELRLLGGVQFRATDGRNPELILAHEKSFALLAYLAAAHPFGSHRRDSLVALLWPELDQEHARTGLRKALHGLRRTIGEDAIVSAGDETIGIADAVLCYRKRDSLASTRSLRAVPGRQQMRPVAGRATTTEIGLPVLVQPSSYEVGTTCAQTAF